MGAAPEPAGPLLLPDRPTSSPGVVATSQVVVASGVRFPSSNRVPRPAHKALTLDGSCNRRARGVFNVRCWASTPCRSHLPLTVPI